MRDSPADFAAEVALDPAALESAQDALAARLEAAGVPAAACYKVRLVIEELVANLIMHGRFAGPKDPARLSARIGPGTVLIEIDDRAAPFDPREAPPRTAPPGEAIGGLGLPLVLKMAELRDYRRLPEGWNRTVLAIRWAPA